MKFFKKPRSIIIIAIIICIAIIGYATFRITVKKAVPTGSISVQLTTLTEESKTSGKVKPSQDITLAFESGGKVTSINAKNGEKVAAGQVIATIENDELGARLKQAQTSLESEKINLEKLKKPADDLANLQANDALSQAQDAKKKAEDDIKKAYDDGFSNISNTFLDLPAVMDNLYHVSFDNLIGAGQWNIDYFPYVISADDNPSTDRAKQYRDDAYNAYQKAKAAYDKTFDDFKATTRYADNSLLENLINETYDTTKLIAEAVKNLTNLIQFYQDKLNDKDIVPEAISSTYLSHLGSSIGTVNKDISTLLLIKNTIENDQQIVTNSDRVIAEKQEAIAKLKEGADDLDIKLQENRIQQAEAALAIVQSGINKTILTAPFAGVIATEDLNLGQLITPNQPVATLISKSKFEIEANISESDIAKVKIGNPAVVTLDSYGNETFDAIVTAIDQSETVVGGIQSYKITLQFTKEDDRIKSGMTANMRIETAKKEHVLVVPELSIITKDNKKYVLIDNGQSTPEEREITVGIKGSNEFVEVLSGLKEGENIINFGTVQQ